MSNHIKKFTQEQKDAAKLGAEGGLGILLPANLNEIQEAVNEINTASRF